MPHDHDPYKAHRLSFFAILIIEQGTLDHQVDFQKYNLIEGDCLIISKNQIHSFYPESSHDGHLILFTEEFLLKHLSLSTLSKISRLYNYHMNSPLYSQPEMNQTFIQTILEELSNPYSFAKAHIIAAYLSIYFMKLEQANQSKEVDYEFDRNYELFNRFRAKVVEDYTSSRNAQYYAKELAISYNQLNESCKRMVRKTAKAFIDDYVILEIKRYLAATTLSAKEICFACGFDEPSNFLKYFKKHTGITPTFFRKKNH